MRLHNTFSQYGSVAKGFHWATVLLIFATFPIGYFANGLAEQIQAPEFTGDAGLITRAAFLFSLHKTLGIAALGTAALRVLWTVTQTKPGLLHPDNAPEAMAAETVHWLLYGLMLMVPLTGWMHHAASTGFAPIWWPFGQGLPFVPQTETVAGFFGVLHWLMVWSLFATVGLHIAGALKHHIIDRDSTLRRMLPFGGPTPTPPEQTHSKAPMLIAGLAALSVLAGAQALGVFADGHTHHHADGHSHAPPVSAPIAKTTDAPDKQGWTVQSGTLEIEVTQLGGLVRGQFENWSADIDFNEPSGPGAAGAVDVVIDITSLTLGSVTSQALGSDYFDSATYPTARFTADLEKTDQGYHAIGTLTIRDQTHPLTLPFTLEIDGDTAKMQGAATVQRLDFNIGQSQPTDGTLGFDVGINATLTATRAH